MYKTDFLEITLEDNMELMVRYPDGYFDLAVVDPPFGIGENWKKDRSSKFYKHNSSYKNNEIPGEQYFIELMRISKDQIIWGANYYTDFLPARNSWIVWDKKRDYPTQHLSEGELAWTSKNIPLRIAEFLWNGCCRVEPRHGEHPHEKPIKLYEWIFKNYAKPGDKILDTHLGSGSIAIALDRMNKIEGMNLTLVGCELDPDYYKTAIKRIQLQTAQTTIAL